MLDRQDKMCEAHHDALPLVAKVVMNKTLQTLHERWKNYQWYVNVDNIFHVGP